MHILVKNCSPWQQYPSTCCTDWLEHWKQVVDDASPFCGHAQCLERAVKAVLIQRADAPEAGEYLIPVCKTHARLEGTYPTMTFLISPMQHKTCTCMARKTELSLVTC